MVFEAGELFSSLSVLCPILSPAVFCFVLLFQVDLQVLFLHGGCYVFVFCLPRKCSVRPADLFATIYLYDFPAAHRLQILSGHFFLFVTFKLKKK